MLGVVYVIIGLLDAALYCCVFSCEKCFDFLWPEICGFYLPYFNYGKD